MSQNNQKKLRIAIEGNIASGKSTIIEYLKNCCHNNIENSPQNKINLENNTNKKYEIKSDFFNDNSTYMHKDPRFFTRKNVDLKVYTEPVDLWRNLNGHNLLEYMYKDPSRYSFAFHSYVQLTMLENHNKVSNCFLPKNGKEKINFEDEDDSENVNPTNLNDEKFNINVMERSLYSAKYCFLENIYKSGNMQAVEYEILDKWFNWMIKEHDCNLDLIFYLRTSPETCYNRLNMRGRPEETTSIKLDYLQNLHDLHESWLINPTDHPSSFLINSANIYRPSNIIVIDADQSLENVCRNIEIETRQHATSVV